MADAILILGLAAFAFVGKLALYTAATAFLIRFTIRTYRKPWIRK